MAHKAPSLTETNIPDGALQITGNPTVMTPSSYLEVFSWPISASFVKIQFRCWSQNVYVITLSIQTFCLTLRSLNLKKNAEDVLERIHRLPA